MMNREQRIDKAVRNYFDLHPYAYRHLKSYGGVVYNIDLTKYFYGSFIGAIRQEFARISA